MRLLLDTHIWLWSHLEPDRLGKGVAEALEESNHELWLSPISLCELLILVKKNKVALDQPVVKWVAQALERAPLREAHVTFEIALDLQKIDPPLRDPADRFLAATARVFDLTLVTADERLLALKDVSLMPNQ